MADPHLEDVLADPKLPHDAYRTIMGLVQAQRPEEPPVEEDWTPWADLLEGRIPVHGFRVVTYLDADGEAGMDWHREGERITAARALGDILGAAFEMFHRHLHEEAP